MTIQVREKVEPEVRVKSVPEVLRHAALVIEERGWCQNTFEWGGRVCMDGAIGVAEKGDAAGGGSLRIYDYLRDHLGGDGAITWNDKRGRTAAEVTAALRSAADAYETGPVRP